MDPVANAALVSWTISPAALALLALTATLYVRGWRSGRRLLRYPNDKHRLAAFLCGILIVWFATESPLDTFDGLLLSVHMTQHLLLMMVAPPLILLGRPTIPLLRGLPKTFAKEGLGPFLTWPLLKKTARVLVAPQTAWGAFALSTIFWHVPKVYELALADPFWHGVQHATFFWTGILFWWPIIEPTPAKPRWPLWTKIPYLLFADIVNTVLSAFFVFSGRILYPSYQTMQVAGMSARDDQTLAGLIMWVPGSLVYLVPTFVLVIGLFSGGTQTLRSQPERVKLAPAHSGLRVRFLPRWRRLGQATMLLLSGVVLADGWFGPPAAPLNLAGVLPWIHWRALSLLALLVIGNLFCMVCPFTFLRDIGRKVLPAKFRWPRRLRSKWIPVSLLIVYFWCYETFSLWDSPFVTACVIAGYFVIALAVDGTFRGASFCKYVCPIGQFQFITSLVSPREVAVKSQTCMSNLQDSRLHPRKQ